MLKVGLDLNPSELPAAPVNLCSSKKGNEVQVQKAKRKAERFLEEVNFLKKIRPDDISKLALSKAKDWKEVLQQKNCTLNDRCIAMLANYEAVQKQVEVFHNSNPELVLKIADLIKQWEEKSNHLKKSPKEKKNLHEMQKDRKNGQKAIIKTRENQLNCEKKESDINENGTNEENNLKPYIIDNSEMEDKINNKTDSKKIISDVESLSNTNDLYNSNSDDDVVESTAKVKVLDTESDNADEVIENSTNCEASDIESSNDYKTVENVPKIKKDNPLKNRSRKKKSSNKKSVKAKQLNDECCEENLMEFQNSNLGKQLENCDSENLSDVKEIQEIRGNKNGIAVDKLQSDVSEFIKKMDNSLNNSGKKLKEIALLNLDELEGLDEIPVNRNENAQSSDPEGTSEDEKMDTSHNKRNDPFFLGCGDDDSISDGKFDDFSKNESYSPEKKKSFFSNYNNGYQGEKNIFFQQKESSNDFEHKRKFQKFSTNNQFLKKDSAKFKNDKGSFQSFKKDKFKTRNHDKFESKHKNSFDRNNYKNQKGFSQHYEKKKHENNSNDLYRRNGEDKHLKKHKGPSKEENKSLHPSWEAKRKQKELINTSFQGKRMVFDD